MSTTAPATDKSTAQSFPLIYGLIPLVMQDVGSVSKDRKNEQQKYSFRGIEDMYLAVHPALVRHGVFCAPTVLKREEYRFEKTNEYGKVTTWMHVTMKVEHRFYASDGSFVSVITYGEGLDNSDKASNKAMSGAMKYALIELFCVPTKDIEDSDRDTPEAGTRRPKGAVTDRDIPIAPTPAAAKAAEPVGSGGVPAAPPSTAKPEAVRHGVDCFKMPHRRGATGYLHAEDDDTPYDVDGIEYCGRCHFTMDGTAAPAPKSTAKPETAVAGTNDGPSTAFAGTNDKPKPEAPANGDSGLIDQGRRVNFARAFKDALPKDMQKLAEELRQDFLFRMGFIGADGKGTSAVIPVAEFEDVRKRAIAWAKALATTPATSTIDDSSIPF